MESNSTEVQADILHAELSGVVHLLEWIAAGIDIIAILLMLVGTVRFLIGYVTAEFSHAGLKRVRGINAARMELGRYILVGLELLIVSDIIHTALSLQLEDLLYLGLLVLIRSVISFFLDREIKDIRKELADDPD